MKSERLWNTQPQMRYLQQILQLSVEVIPLKRIRNSLKAKENWEHQENKALWIKVIKDHMNSWRLRQYVEDLHGFAPDSVHIHYSF